MRRKLDDVWELVKKLRSPKGCPWDRKQTNKSLSYNLLEEVYEVIDAIEKGDEKSLKEELGDLLFLTLMHIRIGEEEGKFTLEESIEGLIRKMERRHPHVFGRKKFADIEELLESWEKSKSKGIFEGISFSAPALLLAQRLTERAKRVGFDWQSPYEVLEKVDEEIKEIIKAKNREEMKREFGDLLFALANLARHLDINAEEVTREASKRFVERFKRMEKEAKKIGKSLSQMELEEMEEIWQKVKKSS